MKKISIIIPVFNEEKYVSQILGKVLKADTLGLKKEIIIVNDGSTDNSDKIIKSYLSHKKNLRNILYIKKIKNSGKGASLKLGFKKAKGDIILIQDSDLEYDPKDYPKLLLPFIKNRAEVVYGSRTLGIKLFGNHYSAFSFYLGGKLLTFIINILLGVKLTDQPTGYKILKCESAKYIAKKAKENDFSFEIEITAILARKKYKIIEVPIHYHARNVKEGKKIKFKDFLKSVLIALKYKFFKIKTIV